MSIDLRIEPDSERAICDALRAAAVEEIARRGITENQLADLLDTPAFGVYSILEQNDWSFSLGYRVTTALGLEVTVTIERVEQVSPAAEVRPARAA